MVLQPQSCLNNTGLGFFAFARHYLRNHYCFLFLRLLRCFSSAGSPPCFKHRWWIFHPPGCPIRKSPDQHVCAAPQGLSQLNTSFIASKSLGIPHTPFIHLLIVISLQPSHNSIYFLKSLLDFNSQYVKELCAIHKP